MNPPVFPESHARLPWADGSADPIRVGTVFGVLLNHRGALEAIGPAVDAPPYKGAPKAPVLYVKPRNAVTVGDPRIPVPDDAPALEIGACLGLVIGRTASRLSEAAAMDAVAGFVPAIDVSVPHTVFYRPSIRFKARDGFCPIGPAAVPRARVGDPGALSLRVSIDGQWVQTGSTADWVRPAARLLAEITDFMTLSPGDVLLTGVPVGAPQARLGQRVAVEIDRVGRLEATMVSQAAFEGSAR